MYLIMFCGMCLRCNLLASKNLPDLKRKDIASFSNLKKSYMGILKLNPNLILAFDYMWQVSNNFEEGWNLGQRYDQLIFDQIVTNGSFCKNLPWIIQLLTLAIIITITAFLLSFVISNSEGLFILLKLSGYSESMAR